MDNEELRSAHRRGLFARDDALALIRERFGVPGSGDSSRVYDVRIAGGFEFEVLPERGFDIGRAWVGGVPISWTSPISDQRPLDRPGGRDWIDRFTGGLLTTCGLEHIGAPIDDLPMHGSIGFRPAGAVTHSSGVERGLPYARLSATTDFSAVFGPSVRLHRSIVTDFTSDGLPRVSISDRIENDGPGVFQLKALYHLNFGAPAVVPGTVVEFAGSASILREPCDAVPDPRVLPEPVDELTEAVAYHAGIDVDQDGWSRATMTSPNGIRVDVRWGADTLPHPHQWILPTRNRWAVGIEPATSPLFGQQEFVTVDPGASRHHQVQIVVQVESRIS